MIARIRRITEWQVEVPDTFVADMRALDNDTRCVQMAERTQAPDSTDLAFTAETWQAGQLQWPQFPQVIGTVDVGP